MPDDQDLLFDEPLESYPPEREPAAEATKRAKTPQVAPPPEPVADAAPEPAKPVVPEPPSTPQPPPKAPVMDKPDSPIPAKRPPLPADLKFEDALDQLEAIVDRMETGELELDQCLDAFEQGMLLSKFCMQRLKTTERKVEILTRNAGGDGDWDAFEPADDDADTDDDDDAP